ncbi:methionine synthase reductase-like isoform X2 [Xenia sp. Carnegie-2017]|uniref:methionine synthase reductase-like isoform X2 n=1 Tax=Xenia sp. Carnegie-2017 TaxID=2897299 RepID=UPI001F046D36|nr:methionine synthase reductase-like isoform X2 [Xenia sp. Carnegie-2017]
MNSLGDTNYTNFCNCSKNLNSRLLELGATHFYPPGFADDAVGLELVVEPWIEGLWPALQKELKSKEDNTLTDTISIPTIDNAHEEGNTVTTLKNDHEVQSCIDTSNKNCESSIDTTNKNCESSIETLKSNEEKSENENNEKHNHTNHTNQRSDELLPSLRLSTSPLSKSDLSIPHLPTSFLSIKFTDEVELNKKTCPWQGGAEFPGSASSITKTNISSACQMTTDDAVKIAYCLTLDTGDVKLPYNPGDSFGIICPNGESEVDELIDRLGYRDQADQVFSLEGIDQPQNTKRAKQRPDYIPQKCTIRQALTTCLEIRAVPRKAFLRTLCEFTSNPMEKRRLQELCSKEGASHYSQFIREPHVSFFDILNAFPSCQPPFEKVLEHLPRLLPRPYSVASSPLKSPAHLRFVFNVVRFPSIVNVRRERCGLCTSWLQRLSKKISKNPVPNEKTLEEDLTNLSMDQDPEIGIILRNPTGFHLPDEPMSAVIMIGPGTGVAPFIGFLEHRRHLNVNVSSLGPTWLFYGCRHKDRDFLFKEELYEYEQEGILTKLIVSFSRDNVMESFDQQRPPKYVQDNIQIWAKELCDLIDNCRAYIFVCGDAKNMAKNVLEAFVNILQNVKGLTHEQAKKEIWKLREQHRYVEDVWT